MYIFIKLCRKKKKKGRRRNRIYEKVKITGSYICFWLLTRIGDFNCMEHVDYTSGEKIDIFTVGGVL